MWDANPFCVLKGLSREDQQKLKGKLVNKKETGRFRCAVAPQQRQQMMQISPACNFKLILKLFVNQYSDES